VLPAALLCALLPQAAGLELELLPGERLGPLLPADPHETANALVFRSGAPSLEGAVGSTAGLLRIDAGELQLQLELGAALFLGFLPGDGFTFGIHTVDGLLRVPVSATWGPLRASLEWAHVSAHYADGVRYGDQVPDNLDGYSRELFRLLGAWELPWVQPYVGLRQLVHSIPEAPGLGAQLGAKAQGGDDVGWYQALDLAWNAEHGWSTRVAAQGGLLLRGEGRALRIGLAAYRGPALAGKREGEPDSYLGGTMSFDWHGGWR
jgi:hypothetical protein